ncbi:Rha family transcriptional regulator [Vagococcus salmoninarum]|uniref:Rha family transcriptional regulator n=1 Tax=Vagococcus salmoninarum TaxID=2739 RepID=UPI001881DFA2|nr:Rha family transcriptional regulator [Vagococcus salmoninarum]MBE9390132.1 ORF6C domain-containing protein [Vagococcus salmoninarum]
MAELVIMKNQEAVTTSLQVAEYFEKNHKHVLVSIDELKLGVAGNWADLFYEDTYIHPQNKQVYRLVIMTKKGWTLLAMGFTGKKAIKFKLDYINAFEKMEERIKSQVIPLTAREQVILALAANEETNVRVDLIEIDLKEIKENSLITTEDKNSIDRIVKRKVYSYCKDRDLKTKAKSMLFQDIGRSIKEMFNIPHRGRIKLKDFEAAIEFISDWEPSAVTKAKIKQIND